MRFIVVMCAACLLTIVAAGVAVAEAGTLPCIPVIVQWPVPANSATAVAGPQLAVLMTDVRPKDAQVIVDGRFVGRSRFFNGKNGYLYLEPGHYRVELTFGGYRTEVFEIDAEPECRFEIRHRMVHQGNTPKERSTDPPGKGVPFARVLAPQSTAAETTPRPPSGGPETALRPDLASSLQARSSESSELGASIHLQVSPSIARVLIDGRFVATGDELGLMEGPLAVPVGLHSLEVRAPGYRTETRTVELAEGAVLSLEIVLDVENQS